MTGIGPFGPPPAAPSIFTPEGQALQAQQPGFGPAPITPSLLGPDPAPVGDKAGLSGLEAGGNVLAVAGLVTQAIGSFYAAESQKFQLKSQALSLDFEQSIANINARAAEADAVAIFAAGRRRRAQIGLRFGQVKATTRVSAAARGIQAGVGSAAEVATSVELASAVDALTIDANTFRAVSAARRRAIDFRNQALLTGVSARNVRESGRSISPELQAFTTLLGGAGEVASGIAQRSRFPGVGGVPRTSGVTQQAGRRRPTR